MSKKEILVSERILWTLVLSWVVIGASALFFAYRASKFREETIQLRQQLAATCEAVGDAVTWSHWDEMLEIKTVRAPSGEVAIKISANSKDRKFTYIIMRGGQVMVTRDFEGIEVKNEKVDWSNLRGWRDLLEKK